jgi:hypothetical protein
VWRENSTLKKIQLYYSSVYKSCFDSEANYAKMIFKLLLLYNFPSTGLKAKGTYTFTTKYLLRSSVAKIDYLLKK